MNIHDFTKMKMNDQKISMVTCYDFWSACIVSQSDIDCVLVGDSSAMVMHGHKTTLPASVEMILMHLESVAKGADNKFIIADLPFLSFRKGFEHTMNVVEKMMKSGAHAVKLEGAKGNETIIEHIVQSGVPVMGHLGLTPQLLHALGGFKVQGRDNDQAKRLLDEAKRLEESGCFAMVLECVPVELGKEITNAIKIPTIGIGAGPFTSGQVLVLQDLLGMQPHLKFKFLKKYLNGFDLIKNALNQYNADVKSAVFPDLEQHCFEG